MTATSRLGVFTIVFSISYAALYVTATEVNLAVFTYHPALGEFGWWAEAPKRGPAMYWYGWMLTSLAGAAALGALATLVPEPWLQRIIIAGVAFAVLYMLIYTLALFIYDKATIELEFLKDRLWSMIAAAVAALLVAVLAPAAWTRRVWPGWVWVVPLGAITVLVYYLSPYFTR